MNARRWALLVMICWGVATTAGAVPAMAEAERGVVKLALVPFANNTGQAAAHTQLMPLLERLLTERGLAVVPSDTLRPLLRQHRIRSRGWISRQGAELIVSEVGADFLLLGSWDVLRETGNVEVGLSLRLLDPRSMTLVGAVSFGGSGEDRVGWLGRGRVDDVELLATRLIGQALDQLLPSLAGAAAINAASGDCPLAIIPLDNFSAVPHAGDIVTGILLARLLSAGYPVVEPGFVRELGLVREVISRGGVDRASARALRDSLGVCRVITGAVQQFAPARGASVGSVPLLAVGLRVSSATRGVLLTADELEGAGDDADGVFQLGRVHAITPLAVARIDKFVAELTRTTRKDSFDGNHQ